MTDNRKKKKDQMTNNDVQNTTQKTLNRVTPTRKVFGRVNSSCCICDIYYSRYKPSDR